MGSKNLKVKLEKECVENEQMNKLKELKLKLEKEGIENIKKTRPINLEKDLIQIIKNGEKEFVEKIGRNTTYGEMREMYG